MYNILICDDDPDIVGALTIYLSAEGYRLFPAGDGRQALEIVREHEIHLVLMDIMMPELDGIAATAKLREEEHNLPIILITAKSEEGDKVLGLNVGADDYITKPFSPLEVQARVRSQLRRYTRLGSAPAQQGCYRIGGVELNDEAKQVSVDGEAVSLTPMEYGILLLLMRSPGKVFSSAQIYREVCGEGPDGAGSAVAVHIRHLREKIEHNPSDPRYLKVVWGQGYRMEREVRRDG